MKMHKNKCVLFRNQLFSSQNAATNIAVVPKLLAQCPLNLMQFAHFLSENGQNIPLAKLHIMKSKIFQLHSARGNNIPGHMQS